MQLLTYTLLKNNKYYLGKTIGAGLATIGSAGAGVNKRFMHRAALASTRCHSSRSLIKSFYDSGTRVYQKPYVHNPGGVRNMAVRVGNVPESTWQVKDPQSLKNNPSMIIKGKEIRHAETHLQQCNENPNCLKQTCTQVCGTPGKRIAVEHWTHGKPNTPEGIVVPVSPTDYTGKPVQQNAVIYHIPHVTTNTQEIPNLTSFINQPGVIAAVEPYENT